MIILDTHAWIWWVIGSRKLSSVAARRIEEGDDVGIPAISVWEVGMLVAKGRLGLDRDVLAWAEEALRLPRAVLVPMTPAIAIRSTRLPGDFQGDPADRIIVATAIENGSCLVTKDERIRGYPHVRAVW